MRRHDKFQVSVADRPMYTTNLFRRECDVFVAETACLGVFAGRNSDLGSDLTIQAVFSAELAFEFSPIVPFGVAWFGCWV